MSDYTPTTDEIRERWINFDGGPDATDAAEFDRWLTHIKDSAYWEGYGDGQDSERAFG